MPASIHVVPEDSPLHNGPATLSGNNIIIGYIHVWNTASGEGDAVAAQSGRMEAGHDKRAKFRVKVEARRAREKPKRDKSLLSLDFANEEPASPKMRVLYFLGSLACIAGALVGAVLPVIPAIPLWILAAILMSHAFPAFGRWLAKTRIYRWLVSKLDAPEKQERRPVMTRKLKARLMAAATALMIVILAAALIVPRALSLSLPHGYMWVVSIAVSVLWIAALIYLYAYVREPEATIRTRRQQPYHESGRDRS